MNLLFHFLFDGMVFLFFQAEDGIRAHCVTGVQTCALPIWLSIGDACPRSGACSGHPGNSHGTLKAMDAKDRKSVV